MGNVKGCRTSHMYFPHSHSRRSISISLVPSYARSRHPLRATALLAAIKMKRLRCAAYPGCTAHCLGRVYMVLRLEHSIVIWLFETRCGAEQSHMMKGRLPFTVT